MNGIVLAAGFGTRFDPRHKYTNKAFLQAGGNMAVNWVVDDLSTPEIESIHIAHNGKFGGAFRRWKATVVKTEAIAVGFPYIKLHNTGAMEPSESPGAVGSLAMVLDSFEYDGPFVLCCVDTLVTYPVRLFLDTIRRDVAAIATIDGRTLLNTDQYGKVELSQDGEWVRNFYEKSEVHFKDVWLGPAFFPASACALVREYVRECRGLKKKADNLGTFISWYLYRDRIQAWKTPDGHTAWDIGCKSVYESARRRFKKGAPPKRSRSR